MDELKEYYRNALGGRIEALESARKALSDGDSDAEQTIRRIAHSLKGSGGTYGFPEVSATAGSVETADEEDLLVELSFLLELLRDISAGEKDVERKVLVVEDDPELVHLLELKLRSEQREIVFAQTGEEAKTFLRDADFSLVILDLILPDYDGRNLLVEIRETPKTAGIPVIVTTAKSNPHIQSECYALGADAFFEKPFDPEALTAAVADKIHRAEAQKVAANKDPLTGLPNRAGFLEMFEQTHRLASRRQSQLAVGFIDIDLFKSVNDRYGHNIGDQVLQKTAAILSDSLRKSDILARWGGEEFVAAFPDTDVSGAAKALEKALDHLRDHTFTAQDEQFSVTFSAGITAAGEEQLTEELIAEADRLLYLAKENGRNQVLSDEAQHDPRPDTIFLAEDDDLIASVVKHRLEKAEYQVDHFTDGLQALEAAKEDGMYALYILDVKMPGMDGFELLKNIRRLPSADAVPVVMLTSMGSEKDVIRGFSLGADDYILKPFSPGELISRVNRLMKKT
ncbi:MAG: response regulator [Candidatus Marinimicrobia bacterium]|nr:response regulator [Candidatus Neomarinimicrobiota bacterium]MCF7829726.1 response regulator [Candidatus Neomarinimicrobiota bacterium]MCF7881676.1 response regulator [Candidatus Neomarinimicrobiota bacterium]